MPEDDFSFALEITPSLYELDTWLQNAYTNRSSSPETSSYTTDAPETIASSVPPPSGTAASSVPPGSVPSTVDTNPATQDDIEDSNDSLVKIQIEYLFFFEEEKKNKTPSNSRSANKRKAAPESESKYKALPSERGKLSLMWSTENPSLSQLKIAAIEEIRFKDAIELGSHAEELNELGSITWNAVIPHGGRFAANQKATLETSDHFAEFLEEWGGASESRKFTITLVEKDPTAAAQKKKALSSLKKKQQGENVSPEPEPTAGASISAAIVENIQNLRAEHLGCARLTGSSDLPVFLNPANPDQFIPLTLDRLALWGRAMAQNKDVTLKNPPKSPPFNFITKEEYHLQMHGTSRPPLTPIQTPNKDADTTTPPANQSPASLANPPPASGIPAYPTPNINPNPGVGMNFQPYTMPGFGYMSNIPYPAMPFPYPHMPAYGQPPYMPPPPIPNLGVYPAQPSVSANRGPATPSPVPSDEHIELEDYFRFAHVDYNNDGVVVALGELGINHYSQFQNFQATELEDAGMKRAHARALISSYKRFERHIKSIQSRHQ